MINPFIYKGVISKMGERKIISIREATESHYEIGEPVIVLKAHEYNEILKRGGLYDSQLRV